MNNRQRYKLLKYILAVLVFMGICVAVHFGAKKVWQKELDKQSAQQKENWERHRKTFTEPFKKEKQDAKKLIDDFNSITDGVLE